MSRDPIGGAAPIDAVGADAVCAQCGTVNPDGTFICRTCGNNLRDQRLIRLQAEQQLQQGEEAGPRSYRLTSVLSAAGLLIIVAVMLNVEAISAWLVALQDPTVDTAALLWDGAEARRFAPLSAQLGAAPLNEAAALDAHDAALPGAFEDGLYAAFLDEAPVASVQLEVEGDSVYFVAQLIDAPAEVRGHAPLQGGRLLMPWENGGVAFESAYYPASGAAVPLEEGGIECYGQSDYDGNSYRFVLYRVAE